MRGSGIADRHWAPKDISVPKPSIKERNLRIPKLRQLVARTPGFAAIARLLERFAPMTENRGVPGSSPGLAIRLSCKYAAFAALSEACETAGNGRWPFPGSATEGQMPGWHVLARAREYTMRFVCGRCRAERIATQGLTDNDRSDAFARALARLACVGQIDAARAVFAPGAVSCGSRARRGGIGCRWCLTPLMWKRTPSDPVGAAAKRPVQKCRPACCSVSSNGAVPLDGYPSFL
jgi:hypothetical protein